MTETELCNNFLFSRGLEGVLLKIFQKPKYQHAFSNICEKNFNFNNYCSLLFPKTYKKLIPDPTELKFPLKTVTHL